MKWSWNCTAALMMENIRREKGLKKSGGGWDVGGRVEKEGPACARDRGLNIRGDSEEWHRKTIVVKWPFLRSLFENFFLVISDMLFSLWFLYFNLNDSYCFLSMNEKELELLSLFFNPEITILWNIMFSLKIPLLHLNICNSQFS